MQFRTFRIQEPTFLGSLKPDNKYIFDLVKTENGNSFVIAQLDYNEKEGYFNFKSVGTRYLKYREEGLEKWLLTWCELKQIEIEYGDLA